MTALHVNTLLLKTCFLDKACFFMLFIFRFETIIVMDKIFHCTKNGIFNTFS